MIQRRALAAAPLLAVAAVRGATAQAQDAWPGRPLRMVIPWSPGQQTDVIGRIVAHHLSEAIT